MSTDWKTTMKPNFIAELRVLPAREMHQVMEKIDTLVQDPKPDGKVKKQLKHIDPHLHRIRCGDYRVFYTFERPYISLLALRRRQEDTYDKGPRVEFLSGFDPDFPTVGNPMTSPLEDERKQQSPAPAASIQHMLPRPITSELLNSLRIPPQYHAALLAVHNEDELLDCSGVPPNLLERLVEYLFPPEPITSELLNNLRIPPQYHATLLAIQSEEELLNCPSVPDQFLRPLIEHQYPSRLQEVMQQPDLVLHGLDDLVRFKQGELLGFLLKLSPDQETYVRWALHASGPALLKGGPGTGKSTIALYRTYELVKELREQRRKDFRILFATYTEALMRSSEQLLRQLLGEDVRYVDVKTTDALASSLLGGVHATKESDIRYCLEQAIEQVRSRLQGQTQRQTIERLSQDYLEQEINQVIIARQISSLQEYLNAVRPGRKVPLNATQRRAVWFVYEVYQAFLDACRWTTWSHLRVQAQRHVAQGRVSLRYDAVIIDEVQDLDVSALRMLIQLCANPNRLFITADANQAIYGSGFSWNEVHASLRFQGRAAVLRTNYRSTREIGEATRSYLADSGLEQDAIKQDYAHKGVRPRVYAVSSREDEIELLKQFLTTSVRELRFSLGSCAILCPNKPAGQRIVQKLNAMGLQATFMSPREVDLERPGIKVMMLKTAKGLEFPIVAIAGFLEISAYMASDAHDAGAQDADRQQEREEALARDRRSIYVGMTRAMRALLVIVPANTRFPLLTGFDRTYWDLA